MRTKIRRRPNGRWYVYAVDADGEHSQGGYQTQREAKAKAAEIRTDAARGRYVAPRRLTVASYLESEWLPARENSDLSPNSRDVERVMVRAWIIPRIGDIELQKLAPRDLDRLYADLRAGGGRSGAPLRGKSVRNVHVLLSKALGDAVRRGHLISSPTAAVDPPARDDSVSRTAWSREETVRFLETAADDRLHAIWRLVLATGLRRGELLGLTWDDIEEGSALIVRQVLVRPGGGPLRVYVRETTKSHRSRRVRFDETTGAALRRWKAEQASERLAFGAAWKADGGLGVEAPWIVTEPDGAVVNPDTLLRRWKALVKAAGVTPIGLHGARHTHAELSLSSGTRPDVVQRQLGHASVAITLGVYGHPNDVAAATAAEALGAILGQSGPS
jgi:integrase